MLTYDEKSCIINKKRRNYNMKPNVFISSTFYDLKYVREDLANFIRSRDFEPVLFENGDVWYIPGKELESSCYDAMKKSDMAILIIGGNFGTESNEFTEEQKKEAEEFVSITQNEFKTAIDNDITVFAFVDSKVANEYDIYIENKDKFIENPNYINFKATNDIRVFNFLQYIYSLKTISVTNFSKVSEIKEFLAKQWSDMFKRFLEEQKRNKEIDTIKKSINKLENVVANMEMMMDAVGKSVLKESKEYENIKNKQQAQEICETLTDILPLISTDYKGTRADDLFDAIKESSDKLKSLNSSSDDDLELAEHINEIFYNCFLKRNFDIDYVFNENVLSYLLQINEQLKKPDIVKEIKILLDKKYYDRIVLFYDSDD